MSKPAVLRPLFLVVVLAASMLAMVASITAISAPDVGATTPSIVTPGTVQTFSADADFLGVACPTASLCLAVASGDSGATVTPLDPITGALASGLSIQTISGAQDFDSIACPTASTCVAVGVNSEEVGVAVPINPSTGAIASGQSVQSIPGTQIFYGVACASATLCLAVGETSSDGGVTVPINPGTGAIASGQGVVDASDTTSFEGVTCLTATTCLEVGYDTSNVGIALLVSASTGSDIYGIPVNGTENLYGITCPTATMCLAAGTTTGVFGAVVPIDVSGGSLLSAQSLQTISPTDGLHGVTCVSATLCLAVGEDAEGSVVPISPSTGAILSGQSVEYVPGTYVLAGITCVSASQCLAVGQSSPSLEGAAVPLEAAPASNPYSPLTPVRICDTRAGNPSGLSGLAALCVGHTLTPGSTMTISAAGLFGVPADASAVVLNVTVVNPAAPGYVTIFPGGSSVPTASNINYVAGEVVPNLVQVGLGLSGEISIFSSASTDIVVDLEGYYAPTPIDGPGSGLYNALTSPARICDTRVGNYSDLSAPDTQCDGTHDQGETLAAESTLSVQVGGDNSIPADASAVVINLTAVNEVAPGFLTAYPGGSPLPTASNVNYMAGQPVANRVIVPLSSSGTINVYSSAQSDVVVDVSGYFTGAGGSGATFSAESVPVRICDTRAGNPSNLSGAVAQCNGQTITPGATEIATVEGLAGVPTDAVAVSINLTGVAPNTATYLTVFPSASVPDTSDLNLNAGEVRANLTIATLSASGNISIYNPLANVDAVVDVDGWYSS